MSALAGICKFDPREPVGADELTALAKGIDYVGPDVHGDFIDGHFGMVHRALFTTPQDHKETQPLIRHGCALTWDGRLDNRDELMNACGVHPTETVSDAEVVLNAYKKWGYEVFAMLEGDWALAIYDYESYSIAWTIVRCRGARLWSPWCATASRVFIWTWRILQDSFIRYRP